MTDSEKLNAIEGIARQHATPASNPGAHALARQILNVIDSKKDSAAVRTYSPQTTDQSQNAYTAEDRR